MMSGGDGNRGVEIPPAAREGCSEAVGVKKKKQENASTGASAATIRALSALSARMFAFYFRAPVKAFFRARVE